MDILKAFVIGVVGIGIVTAVLLPGRQTVGVITAGGTAATNLLRTSITGK